MVLHLMSCLLLGTAPVAAAPTGKAPLELAFRSGSGLPPGRAEVYDPKTGIFHIHFRNTKINEPSVVEVTKVTAKPTRPIVFRLTGVPRYPDYPLVLRAGRKGYYLDPKGHDKKYFRVEYAAGRDPDSGVVTVTFTPEGQALLTPGTQIYFIRIRW
jgi:hypothetical protein